MLIFAPPAARARYALKVKGDNVSLTDSAVRGASVLITGAARGMGELYARRAVAAGARFVALWDIDGDAATTLATDLARSGSDVRAYIVDVSQLEDIQRAYAETIADAGSLDIVINNAGIVRGALFWEHDPQRDIEATMRINTLAAMWLSREALPAMIADTSRPKRILNIASAAGTLANPKMSVYTASKWAMVGWSDSLRLELVREGHRHVAVTTFCPSYVSTGMFAGARGPLLTPIMTPQDATRAAWNGMVAGRAFITKPWTVKLAMALRGILPTAVWDVIADKIFHVYSSMDKFTGRS